MSVKHLDHLNLSVRNLAETCAWYARVFGFSVVEEDLQDGVRSAILKSGEAMLCVYEHPDRTILDRFARDRAQLHGVNHFALRVTDRQEWEKVVAREALPIQYGGAYPWPHSTSWYVEDPTGYQIEVVCWDRDQVAFEVGQ